MNQYDNYSEIDPTWVTSDLRFLAAANCLQALLALPGNAKNTRAQVLAFLLAVTRQQKFAPDSWIAFGKTKAYYHALEINPVGLSFKFSELIDTALAAGLVDFKIGFRDPKRASRLSRFRPTEKCINDFILKFDLASASYERDMDAVVVMASKKKGEKRKKRSTKTFPRNTMNRLISEVESYNAFLATQDVSVVDGQGKTIIGAFTDAKKVYRVFNRSSLEHGGRLYRGFWVQLPKKSEFPSQPSRQAIRINGEETIELDLQCHHIHLLYAQKGICHAEKSEDAYEIPGLVRVTVKTILLVAINAKTAKEAWRAALEQLRAEDDPLEELTAPIQTFDLFKKALDAIFSKHSVIRDSFCSDKGTRLQRIDSDIAMRVLLAMSAKGVPVCTRTVIA